MNNTYNWFTIDSRLPSLNEVIDKNRISSKKGNKLKRETQDLIQYYILMGKRNGHLKPVNSQIGVVFVWCEHNKKRDVDNIISSAKFILDAMQETEIIHNDNQSYVKQVSNFVVTRDKPKVVVFLIDYLNDIDFFEKSLEIIEIFSKK